MSDEITSEVAPKRKGGRPRKIEQTAVALQAQGIAPTAEQWGQLLERFASNKLADIEVAAEINARAMKKALRPENEIAPGISVYSPKGTAHHGPKPSHIYVMGPYPIADPGNYDTVTCTELALLAQLQPGDYPVTKSDGSPVKVTVKREFESNGIKPYKTTLIMPIKDDDQKMNWPPLMQVLTEIVTGEPPMASYARYQARIDALEAQLAAVTAA